MRDVNGCSQDATRRLGSIWMDSLLVFPQYISTSIDSNHGKSKLTHSHYNRVGLRRRVDSKIESTICWYIMNQSLAGLKLEFRLKIYILLHANSCYTFLSYKPSESNRMAHSKTEAEFLDFHASVNIVILNLDSM